LETLIAISIGLVVAGVSLFSFSDSHYSAGMISAFILYLNMLFRPMRFLADKFNQLQMGFVACERVFKLLETPSLEQDNGTEVLNHVEGKIEFQNVEFSYLPEQKILHGISFSIEAGKSLAIVGATGSGKTSIINILNRFYPIEKGQILLDDININKYTIASLRSHIGMVLQDVFLFSGSILDNIRLENKDFSKEDAMKLAAELEIDDFFKQLPQDFDYQIIERGNSLSHGQRQVISFFRAIVKNPSILVLDEATSSIDSNTEYYIQKLIPKIIKNKTSIIIAHRLSTIMSADKILVLNKGEIVGEGTHEELLASNAHYQKYFTELE
jgi:ABC-type multidrug transport system fused ATPase/permease subunit